MREIKFRGKRVDNGEWVYGYYFTTPLTIENFGAGHLGDGIKRHCISTNMGVVYAVDPDTVGQLIATYKDENGVVIQENYEGDIIELSEIGWDNEEFIIIASIKYDENYLKPMIQADSWLGGYMFDNFDERLECAKTLGNIHDNPELIKQ